MARKVNLWEYMPDYLKQFAEINQIYQAEQPEFQKLVENTDDTLGNMFIQTADHAGLSRFEKIVGIYPNKSLDLELRRSNMLIRWLDLIPYTMRTLKDKIRNIQGNDWFDVSLSGDYEITIKTRLDKRGQVASVEGLLKAILPCNLAMKIENTFASGEIVMKGHLICAMAVFPTEMISLHN